MCNAYARLVTIVLLASLFLESCNWIHDEFVRHKLQRWPMFCNYSLGDNYHRQALGLYTALDHNQLDTQIQELKKQCDLVEAENRMLKSDYRPRIILLLVACGLLFVINVILYARREDARFLQAEATQEKNHIKLEKHQVESSLKLSREQMENQQELLFRYDLFLKFRVEQHLLLQKNANKVRSKYPALGDAYDKMLEMERERFNELVGTLFKVEDMERLFDIHDENNILTKSDRLLLFMLANNADNEQIAALLNISADNMKSRKSYLKNKIIAKTTTSNGFQRLIELF